MRVWEGVMGVWGCGFYASWLPTSYLECTLVQAPSGSTSSALYSCHLPKGHLPHDPASGKWLRSPAKGAGPEAGGIPRTPSPFQPLLHPLLLPGASFLTGLRLPAGISCISSPIQPPNLVSLSPSPPNVPRSSHRPELWGRDTGETVLSDVWGERASA